MNIKEEIKKDVFKILKDIDINSIIIEKPKDKTKGDYAIPCFTFSKVLRKSPIEIANYIKDNLDQKKYEKVEVVNGYLNIFVQKKVIVSYILNKIMTELNNYGSNNIGDSKNIVIEYSSPNIAKPFGIGHLRSTVIGEALKNIYEKNGYKVYSLDFLGDYGTQFGKVLYAYITWGDEEKVKQNPTKELKDLYVKFHEEAKLNPELDEQGRIWFRKLENNDPEALKLWNWFKEESLKDFKKTYKILGISDFDEYNGEAYYKEKAYDVIEMLKKKDLLEVSEGANVVNIGDDIVPALIQKSDGTSIYITRDLAAYIDRLEKYKFDEILYVVGNEQTLHFEQLKRVLSKMGYDSNKLKHISFGLMLQNGKKMSTRGGTGLNLQDLLDSSISLANKYIEEKNPTLKDKEEVSKKIGVGAVIFNDLKNYRVNDIDFNLEETLSFTGNTGPYIQYTNARINSLLEHYKENDINYDEIDINDTIWNVIFDLYEFPEVVVKSKDNYDPSEIAKYLLNLSSDFNKMYANVKIIDDNNNKTNFNLALSKCVGIVLTEGMRLLGIKMPNKM